MKKFIRLFSLLCILSFSSSYASQNSSFLTDEAESECKLSFSNYKKNMSDKGLPLTMIIGCGHVSGLSASDEDHSHPNCWCVNIENYYLQKNKDEPYWKEVKADAFLDITDRLRPHEYEGEFDAVMLERPLASVLDNPWTLWNVVYMLKEGGEILIDHYKDYKYFNYEKNTESNNSRQFNLFNVGIEGNITDLENLLEAGKKSYGENFAINNIHKKLGNFGINCDEPILIEEKLLGMVDCLACYRMTDIVAVKNAYQPYTILPGNNIATARRTSILSATKSIETGELMDSWRQDVVKKYKIWKEKNEKGDIDYCSGVIINFSEEKILKNGLEYTKKNKQETIKPNKRLVEPTKRSQLTAREKKMLKF